uniref:RRM domain-containing protein n=1 Tax=Salix viminalis TaxID=40686 RepID=A0A6N2KUJ3_SALVM
MRKKKKKMRNEERKMEEKEKVVAFEEHGQVGMCNPSCRTSTLLMTGFGSSEMCDHVADGRRIRRVFNTDPVAQLLDIGKLFQQSWTIVAMLVDYACTPEEVQQHFQSCGTVNRVTILTDKFGQPKGFAYVEFLEVEAVQEALVLNESELHGRQLKVSPKRTNVPGMKQYRPSRFNPYMGYRFRRPYVPPYFYSPYGYGCLDSGGQCDTCLTTKMDFRRTRELISGGGHPRFSDLFHTIVCDYHVFL